MGIDHAALRARAKAERERRDSIDAQIARERLREFNSEVPPEPTWGDVGYQIERKAPWLRGWIRIVVVFGVVLSIFVLLFWLLLWWGAAGASARDIGQWNDYKLTNEQRQWFQNVTEPNGATCCSMADGYPVDAKFEDGGWWVFFHREWIKVPPEAVRKTTNPIGRAVAWFSDSSVGGLPISVIVKCFVPTALQ